MTPPPTPEQLADGMELLPADQRQLIVEHIMLTRGPVTAEEVARLVELNEQEQSQ